MFYFLTFVMLFLIWWEVWTDKLLNHACLIGRELDLIKI